MGGVSAVVTAAAGAAVELIFQPIRKHIAEGKKRKIISGNKELWGEVEKIASQMKSKPGDYNNELDQIEKKVCSKFVGREMTESEKDFFIAELNKLRIQPSKP